MPRIRSVKTNPSRMIRGGMVGGATQARPIPNISGNLAADLVVSGLEAATFTRSTTGTFVDYEGVLRTAAINEPRFEGGRRVENLCLQSEAMATSPWTQTNITTDANSIVAPDGATTADTMTAKADNATRVQTFTKASAPFVFSIYFKRKTGTGAISLSLDGGSTYTVVTVAAEWTRFNITQTLANPSVVIKIAVNGDAVYAWGAQLENIVGSSYALPSEYVPTTTASASKWFTTKPDGSPIFPAPKLLMEGQGQNLGNRSEDLSLWLGWNATFTSMAQWVCPTGANANCLVSDTSNTVNAFVTNDISAYSSTVVTYSLFVKYNSSSSKSRILIRDNTAGSNLATVDINFTLGVPSLSLFNGSCTLHPVIPYGNGWYRVAITVTNFTVGNLLRYYFYPDIAATANTGSVFVWGAQLEASPVSTSYIPTTTAAVTRTTDACSWPLSAGLQAMLASEGTISLNWVPGFIPPSSQIGIVSCDAAVDSLLSVAAGASVTRSTDGTTPITGGATLVTNTQRKLIMRWSAASGKYQISSIASGAVTHGTEGDFDGAFTLGTNLLLHYNNAYPAKYSGLKIFSRQLTDAELLRL